MLKQNGKNIQRETKTCKIQSKCFLLMQFFRDVFFILFANFIKNILVARQMGLSVLIYEIRVNEFFQIPDC
ncbi:hypothetical protein SC09_Contig25orf00524 [Bacillus subtilis]|uniref:Uncharacterized protein n=1 Tax=Bacillus subtilis TaxID=1423 RepID=A0A0D1L4Q6_BACIU|nr:hypothetical protein SC09_Contig25orf00524 [Bacillus subtilis]